MGAPRPPALGYLTLVQENGETNMNETRWVSLQDVPRAMAALPNDNRSLRIEQHHRPGRSAGCQPSSSSLATRLKVEQWRREHSHCYSTSLRRRRRRHRKHPTDALRSVQ